MIPSTVKRHSTLLARNEAEFHSANRWQLTKISNKSLLLWVDEVDD
jgi:hypothetical protein